MKRFTFRITLLTVLLSALSLWSCSDDTQSAIEIAAPEDVPADIHADFTRSYPNSTDVAWTVADGYAVASFFTDTDGDESGHHSAVWYTLDDNHKKMHSAPIRFADLPEAVTAAFHAGEYASLTPAATAHVITRYLDDNVDYIYVIKAKGALEGTVSTTVKLYYTAEGTIVKISSETVYDESFVEEEDFNEFKEWLPQTPADFVKTYVDACYPGARYLHVYENRDFTKVKILDGHVVRTLLFDATGAWTSTATELDYKDIPAEILAAFRSSGYAEWHIRKTVEYATPSDGRYYLISIEKDKNKAELRIEADGPLAEEPSAPAEPSNPGDTSADHGIYLAKGDIEGFILAKYPGATVIKSDYDDDDAEIEIIYDGHKIKVEFELHAQGYVWSQSEWDFDVRDTATLPASVAKTIADKYSDYRLEYLSYCQTAVGESYYEAGLKSSRTKKTIKVRMDDDGTVIAEYDKH